MVCRGTTVGGLSGLDFDPESDTWVAISDDRSELQPARFYGLRVELTRHDFHVEIADVAVSDDNSMLRR